MQVGDEADAFFGPTIDIALIITAVVSSLRTCSLTQFRLQSPTSTTSRRSAGSTQPCC